MIRGGSGGISPQRTPSREEVIPLCPSAPPPPRRSGSSASFPVPPSLRWLMEREKQKFVFIVAWNEIEGKFAITCHNRTAQRQRSGPEARAALKAGIPTVSMGPAWGPDSGLARGSSHLRAEAGLRGSERSAAGGALPKSLLRAKSSPARRPLRSPEAAGAAEEIKALELGKEEEEVASLSLPPSPLQAAELTSPNAEPVGDECSWAGLFSFQDLRAVHQQLCSVNSELEPYLPVFPEEPSGVWTVLFGAPERSEQEMDALCYKLQVYLLHSLDTCGWKILLQVLFTETDDPEEYYESLSELRQKGYEEVLQRARRRIQELLEKHKNTESMVELLELYQMEDEAHASLAEATMELYQYLLQPFRDMRELAMLRRQQIKISVENDYLGPRRIESLQKEDADWQRKAHMAVLSIQDLTVKYFEITAKAQKAPRMTIASPAGTGKVPDWSQQRTGAGFWIWSQECSDWDQKQTNRGHQPLKKES